MKLGVDGIIENASVKRYEALTAENLVLKTKLMDAVSLLREQKNLLNQIGEDIKNGKLREVKVSPTNGDPVP